MKTGSMLKKLATVQVTSEDPAFPIELAFSETGSWRAAKKGEQVIRVVFDEPQTLRRNLATFFRNENRPNTAIRSAMDGTGRSDLPGNRSAAMEFQPRFLYGRS